MVQHYVAIFQKLPRASSFTGLGFQKQYQVFNYTHRKIARGGDDSASCSIRCSRSEGERIFTDFIGNLVQFYVDLTPINPIFEGLVTRITLRTGGVTLTRSTDEMANSVDVVFYNFNTGASPKTNQTSTVVLQDSVDIFGVKHGTFDAGVHYNSGNLSHKTVLRNTLRTIRAYPQISVSNNDRIEGTIVELEIKGLREYAWNWQNYVSTDTTLKTAGATFEALTVRSDLAIFPSNASYIYATGVSGSAAVEGVVANTAFDISQESRSGQTYWQFLQSILEAGDASVQYVCGISRSNIFNATRYVYYRGASTTVKYTVRALEDAGRVRNLAGVIVPGYLVEPDAAIQITDVFANWANAGDNPTLSYVEEITYDGETGKIQWSSADNATLEGVLNGGKYFKRSGSMFGAPVRQLL
jgi:hypothetical protein